MNRMGLRIRFVFATLAVCALCVTPLASGAPVYGAPADLTGSRSEGNPGIATAGDWVGGGGTISWSIQDNGNGTWAYQYTFTGFLRPGISHFILDLTDDCVTPGDQMCVTGFTAGPTLFNEYGPSPSNPSFPVGSSIVGVKFDVGLNAYSFTSNRNPVWGDFYIKGGSASAAWNTGLVNHASENVLDFIARPNGGVPVPEPGTFALLGAGLLIAGLARGRRLLH